MKKRTVTDSPETAPLEYQRRARKAMAEQGKKRTTVVLSPEAQEALKVIIERGNYFSMNEAINELILKEARRK